MLGIWKKAVLFAVGGCGYMGLELLWRGWSHGSMFLAGGSCFLLLGRLEHTQPRLPMPARAAMGALVITSVELLTGLVVNRDYGVWDYRHLPGNFQGQICLPFCLLWLPLSLAAMQLYTLAEKSLGGRSHQEGGF